MGDADIAATATDLEPGDVAVYDHLRATDPDVPDGVYRVVGATGDAVTLLRVADAEGRRRHTGELVTLDRDAVSGFEPAENPDGNQSAPDRFAETLDDLGWELRVFTRALAARPLPAALGLILVAAGFLGQGALPGGDAVESLLVLAGALTLAYVGYLGPE